MNEKNMVSIRKYRRNVGICGVGLIAFSFWSIIKIIIMMVMGDDGFKDIMGIEDAVWEESKYIFLAAVLIIYMIFFMLNLFVGIGAIHFSNGNIGGRIFIIMAVIDFLVQVFGLPTYFMPEVYETYPLTQTASIVIDMTFCFILFDLIYSSFKTVRLTKRLDEGI